MSTIHSFEPIVEPNSTILILGTMPGADSLSLHQYYANKNNYFWDIMFRVFNTDWAPFNYVDEKIQYSERVLLLKASQVALWDMIHSCTREGNSDKNIKNVELNDIDLFLKKNNSIKTIIFNGKSLGKSHSAFWYFKNGLPDLYNRKDLKLIPLNSTSSQNPNNPFMILSEWQNVLKRNIQCTVGKQVKNSSVQ